MNTRKFKENIVLLMGYDNGDDKFSALRVEMHGMATARLAKAINFAVKCMDEDEFYVEVGSFSGFSLISAGYETVRTCIGIDDFSCETFFPKEHLEEAKKNVRQILQTNLQNHAGHNTKFVEADFRNVSFGDQSKKKLAVLFIDGKHTEQEVKETLVWAEPYLADESVIFFDDVSVGGVDKAVRDLWALGAQLLYYASSDLKESNEISGYGSAIVFQKRGQ